MYPSPIRSPESYRLVGKSPVVGESHRRRVSRDSKSHPRSTPRGVQRLSHSQEEDTEFHDGNTRLRERRKNENDLFERLPLDVARAVVNMQDYYVGELKAQRERNETLAAQITQMKTTMTEMEKRLQSHVVLMDGFVKFIGQVRAGEFPIAEKRLCPEIDVARSLGDEYVQTVQSLNGAGSSPQPARSMTDSRPSRQEDLLDAKVESPDANYPLEEAGQQPARGSPTRPRNDDDWPPPIPRMDSEPVRSSGLGANKRKHACPPTQRKVKRRVEVSPAKTRKRTFGRDLDEALSDLEYCPSARQMRFRSESTAVEEDREARNVDGDVGSHANVGRPQRRTRWKAVNVPASHVDSPGEQGTATRDCNSDSDYEQESEHDDDDHGASSSSWQHTSLASSPVFIKPDEDLPPLCHSVPVKPRYSVPRQMGYRYASGPRGKPFKYHRMPKSAALVWQEWKSGLHGNPPIEALEQKHGTSWRTGTLQQRKYASNYVGIRQKVVRKVQDMCEDEGIGPEEACRRLDERVDGRMQMLLTTLRNGNDPFAVIPKRR